MTPALLVIEGHAAHAQRICELPALRADFAPRHVESIAAARGLLANEAGGPDLVLVGLELPDGGAYELRALLREHCPVLLAVAPHQGWAAVQALRDGFADVVMLDPEFAYLGTLAEQLSGALRRCQRQRELTEGAERLELALLGAGLGLWHWDPRTGHSTVNRRWAEILGYRLDELDLSNNQWLQMVHPDDLAKFGGATQVLKLGQFEGEQVEFRMRHKQGHWVWVQSRGKVVLRDANGVPLRLAGTHLDITARKQVEAQLAERSLALEQSLQQLRTTQAMLVQQEKLSALGQLVASVAHQINSPVAAIKASAQLLAEALGTPLLELPPLLRRLDASTEPLFLDLLAQAAAATEQSPSRAQRAMVAMLEARLCEHGIADAERLARQLAELQLGPAWERFLPLLRHEASAAMLSLAHTWAGMSQGTANIQAAVERVAKVVLALKSFAAAGPRALPDRIELQQGIETVLTLYRGHFSNNNGVALVLDCEPVPPLLGWQDELVQLWSNLIRNALQAMAYRGTLTIRVRALAACAEVSIGDTGPGIEAALQEQVFEPFFSTRPAGEGSGLGLYIARRIVAAHAGVIELRSSPGQGCLFLVRLPLDAAGRTLARG